MKTARLVLAVCLAACTTPSPASDAGSDAPMPVDADLHGIHWAMGPALPTPLAYATAIVFPVAASDSYVYVFGGSSASRDSLGTISSAVFRARVQGDTLGAWEPAGDIAPGGTPYPLVGHGLLALGDAMGNPGAAIAGGGSPTGALPLLLAIYCDRTDGHLFDWSRFPPMLTQGQSFGVLAPLDPFHYALVGGIVGAAAGTHVAVADIRNEATSTAWADGPSLPVARAYHSYFLFHNDVYLVGGENNDGTVSDIVRTTHDASGATTGWETVGTIDGAPIAHASFTYRGDAWAVGGIEGGSFTGAASARVRHAPIDASGTIGTFADDGEPLPIPLAASAYATDFTHQFLIGGMTLPDLTATDAVVIGTVY